MKVILDNADEIFGPWISSRLGTQWYPGRGHTIGLFDDDRGPVGACLFESCNGASILVHVAGNGNRWPTREFLWFCSYYPFEQLGVSKVIAPVESTNLSSIRWTEHFGFILEATLKEAAPNGDLLLYTMTREQCKWLQLRKTNGKALCSTAA